MKKNSSENENISLTGILIDLPCINDKQCTKCGTPIANANNDQRLLLVREGDYFGLYQISNLSEFYSDVPFYEQGMGMKIEVRQIQPVDDPHLTKNAFFKGRIDWNDVADSQAIPDALFKVKVDLK